MDERVRMVFHNDVAHLLDAFSFGDATMTVKKHNNEVVRLESMVGQSFKTKDTAQAMGIVYEIVAQAIESGMTGQIAFALDLDGKKVTRVIDTHHSEISYPLPKGDAKA